MESFELIDNFFQIVVLLCAAAAAGIFALRRRSRDLLILSLAYACFAMGTIYYVLYLVIIGIWPQPPRRSLRRLLFSTTISARLILFPHCFRSRRVRSCISRYLIYKTAACTEKETFL